MTGVSMAFILGGSVVRIGVAEKGGSRGGILIGIVVFIAAVSLFVNIDKVKSTEMPMLAIVNGIHPWLGALYAATVFALIFNTAFSLYYSIGRRFSHGNTRRMHIILIAVVIAGYICSFFGFKQLISIMYPILGFMGIVLLLILLVAWGREHKNIIAEKFFRRKMIRLSLKKLHPQYKVSREEKQLFHQLGDASPADTETLKEDVRNVAAEIIENEDDIKKYVEENISVDDDMLQESLHDRIENNSED